MEKNKTEDEKMAENGNGFSFGDALLTQAMSGFRGGGCGGCGGSNGAWFGGGCGIPVQAPYAGLSSIMHGVGNVMECVRSGNENLQREFSFNHQNDLIFGQNRQMSDNMLQLTGDLKDGFAAGQQGFSSVLLELCKCCGDNKLLTVQENCQTRELVREEGTKTRELILTTELRKATDQNNINATVSGINAQANANTQAIIQAIQGICPHPH